MGGLWNHLKKNVTCAISLRSLAPFRLFWRRRNSQVTFSSTSEAVQAKEALDKTKLNGMTLGIFFTKPTHRVLVRGLPNNVSFTDVKREFRGVGHVENDGGNDVAITFDTINDAQAAVASGSGGKRACHDHVLSFDFGNEQDIIRVHQEEEEEAAKLFGEDRRLREPSAREEVELLQIDQ
jgi:RNA recognition motif-containing protein